MKKIEDMNHEELIQLYVDARAALESTLKAITPVDKRTSPSDPLHLMQDAARILGLLFGPEIGFFIQVAPFGEGAGRSNYTSNVERETALAWMVEFLVKNGKSGDWMKHRL